MGKREHKFVVEGMGENAQPDPAWIVNGAVLNFFAGPMRPRNKTIARSRAERQDLSCCCARAAGAPVSGGNVLKVVSLFDGGRRA